MDNSATTNRTFRWRRVLILAIVCFLAGRSALRLPRTTWSLADPMPALHIPEEVHRAVRECKDIRQVLIISIDTCRADHFGCYGYSRNTSPNIDKLAAESVLFQHAIAPVPLTLPSHCSMLTGSTPLQHHVHDNENYRLGDTHTTLAETLRDKGFETGAIIGAFPLDARFGLSQGFNTYDDDVAEQVPGMPPHDLQRPAKDVSDLAEAWLKKHHQEPFFLFLHYFDLHAPYQWHPDSHFKLPIPYITATDRYDSEITYTDHHVGRIIDSLKEKGIYDSTLIILVGDHGESLGARQENWHGFFIYHDTLHVPLIVKIPGASTAVKIESVASLIDIVPTVCESTGVDAPAQVQGISLLAALHPQSTVDGDRAVFCESLVPTKYKCQSLLGLVTNRYKYIRTTRPELYDLHEDPGETDNIIEEYSQTAETLDRRLQVMLGETTRDDSQSKFELDSNSLRLLKSLGYVGGSVETDFTTNEQKDDPKDLIEFHQRRVDAYDLVMNKKYAQAKPLVEKSISQRPDLFEPYMTHLGHVLATNPDPRIRDPEMALAIATCGAKVTEYKDPATLLVLQEAYEAVGRHQDAAEIAVLFAELEAASKELPDAP